MNALKLPEQLKGPWHHALFLTYGMDIPFFENALLSQFGTRCRNKIILADGRQYLEACANYAQSGLVRYLNQRYIAEGIYSPNAAHAKLIMLTNSERGRLAVGSGNLGLQGYASPGELFTQYEYSVDQTETLSAFLSSIEFVKNLITKGYVSKAVARHFDRLLEGTPWLYQTSTNDWQPIRHNLEQSFLEQLVEAKGNEAVEELWILSPFYDASAYALTEMLLRLRPLQTTLLVQLGSTSADPQALARAINNSQLSCSVRAFQHQEDRNLYYHAKLYLLKFKDRAICLQGSPNLSRRAMLQSTTKNGNVEAANLLVGPRDYFDYLFDPLIIEPETLTIEEMDLSYLSSNDSDTAAESIWQLRGGEWDRDKLFLDFRGTLPDLDIAMLNIAEDTFPIILLETASNRITISLTEEIAVLLKQTLPLRVQWEESGVLYVSNPVFACNRASLDATMDAEESDEKIERTGGLDLDDEELEQLVAELESHMVIDRQSIWQVAGKLPPATTTFDDDASRLDYADIDYEMLRQHPKLQQYFTSKHSGSGSARTRLQIILSSITDHFQGLVDVLTGNQSLNVTAILENAEAVDTEEDAEQEEGEKQRRQLSREQRLRNIFKHFIRRFLRGIASPDYRELVGHEVMAHNYIIFAHLLWALSRKEWFVSDSDFVAESLLKTWQFFWGTNERPGYYQQQDRDVQLEILKLVKEYHADSQILASLYHCTVLTHKSHTLRLHLRDFWRHFLTKQPFITDNEVLEGCWIYVSDVYRYEPPRTSAIVNQLTRLAQFETESNFLRLIEATCDLTVGSCYFDRVKARRTINYRQVDSKVRCLFVPDANNILNQEVAVSVLQKWMVYEALDYYRVSFITSKPTYKLLFYETVDAKGIFWNEALDIDIDIVNIKRPNFNWSNNLAELEKVASNLDLTLTIPTSLLIPNVKASK